MRVQRGFTLTELVMVIVILGIVAAISTRFIQFSTQGALDTANRQRMSLTSGIASELISRSLRSALPGSVRTSAGGECIEFFPIVAGSRYRTGSGGFEARQPLDSFKTESFTGDTERAGWVVVYPYAEPGFPDELYGSDAETRASLSGVSESGPVTVNIDGTHEFPEDSPQQRVFLTSDPVSFCRGTDGEDRYLFRHTGYSYGISPGPPSDGRKEVIAAQLTGGPAFSFTPPTRRRNGVVTFEMTFASGSADEALTVNQEVQIRNVP